MGLSAVLFAASNKHDQEAMKESHAANTFIDTFCPVIVTQGAGGKQALRW